MRQMKNLILKKYKYKKNIFFMYLFSLRTFFIFWKNHTMNKICILYEKK
jgi:hypothetical protein